MYKIIDPLINLANNNLQAVSEVVTDAPEMALSTLGRLWCSAMENQARFVSEFTDCMLFQMSRNRSLMSDQMKKMSATTEHVTLLVSHATVRSLAIATNARHINRDRRVFSLPLPNERRLHVVTDRRQLAPSQGGSPFPEPSGSPAGSLPPVRAMRPLARTWTRFGTAAG